MYISSHLYICKFSFAFVPFFLSSYNKSLRKAALQNEAQPSAVCSYCLHTKSAKIIRKLSIYICQSLRFTVIGIGLAASDDVFSLRSQCSGMINRGVRVRSATERTT